MRTVTFSDERVVDLLNKSFVCVWQNIRPTQRFRDGLYDGQTKEQLARIGSEAGANNICAHIATEQGGILHVAQGYHDAQSFIAELRFGLTLSGQPVERLAALYRTRLDETRGRSRLLVRNLERLEKSPLPTIETILKSERAGLR
jgi:hypothetical protein